MTHSNDPRNYHGAPAPMNTEAEWHAQYGQQGQQAPAQPKQGPPDWAQRPEQYGAYLQANPHFDPTQNPKKRKRIFMWFFLAVQVLFLVWIIAGASSGSGHATNCGTLSQQDCDNAAHVGTGIGVVLIVLAWCIVDFLLGVVYLVVRLSRRSA